MIVVITGAPGAGKGTQADLLAERAGYRKISTGDALRNQVRLGTDIGKKAGALMADGLLVPDDVLFEVLKAELGEDSSEKILLDGYPRNLAQAKTLESIGEQNPIKGAVHLDVDRDELIARLSGRRVCSKCGATFHLKYNPPKAEDQCDRCGGALDQRPDDREEKVAVRLDVYEKTTKPILDFYKAEGLYLRVNGNQKTDAVYQELKQAIDQIEARN